jgi:pimeloyl-ACP methyl ester carboxylesterase
VRVTRQRRRVPDCALVVARRDADLSPKQKQGAYLTIMNVPTLAMHGDGDPVVPIAGSALLSAKLLKKGKLKVYEKFPHGMCTTRADVVNPELLAFIAG